MEITRKTFKRCLEGTNHKIKQIKRTAYGYRNFYHLIARIKLEEPKAVIKKESGKKLAL